MLRPLITSVPAHEQALRLWVVVCPGDRCSRRRPLPWMGVEENLVTRTVCPRKRQVPSSLLVNLVKDVPHYQTGDLPISDPACLPAGRCSHSRGRCADLSRLIFPCLKTRKIPLDPPSPLVVASRSTSGSPWVVVPGFRFLRSRAGLTWPLPAAPVSNFLSG